MQTHPSLPHADPGPPSPPRSRSACRQLTPQAAPIFHHPGVEPASPSALAALGLPARRGTCSTIRRSTRRSLAPRQRRACPRSVAVKLPEVENLIWPLAICSMLTLEPYTLEPEPRFVSPARSGFLHERFPIPARPTPTSAARRIRPPAATAVACANSFGGSFRRPVPRRRLRPSSRRPGRAAGSASRPHRRASSRLSLPRRRHAAARAAACRSGSRLSLSCASAGGH